MAIISIVIEKNVYKFDKDTSLISYGNYDDYGYSRDFRFNSVTDY